MELGYVLVWVIKSSIMASILAALIMLVKYALRNKLEAKWHYAIWMLLIIRLLTPYDIQSPWSIYNLFPNEATEMSEAIQTNIDLGKESIFPANYFDNSEETAKDNSANKTLNANKFSSPDKTDTLIHKFSFYIWILAVVWLAGVIIIAIYTITANLKLYLNIKREFSVTNKEMSKLMRECAGRIGLRKSLPIIITKHYRYTLPFRSI